jgi:hypothetical protein
MKSFNLALSHGIVRRTQNILKMLAFQESGQFFGDVGWAIVSEQPGIVPDSGFLPFVWLEPYGKLGFAPRQSFSESGKQSILR